MSTLQLEGNDIHGQNLATGHEVRGLHVPTEIFAEIFVLCLPTSRFVVPSLTAAPLAVSGVCRRWRDAALSTPLLWKSLFLDGNKLVAPESGYIDFCRYWLSRAGPSPLSLSLVAPSASEDFVRPLIDLVRDLSQQWQDIELKLGDLRQTLTFPPREYPLLEKISIVSPVGGFLASFQNAPKLREASVSPYTAHIHLPRHQLTAFGSQNMDVAPFWGFIRDAPNLVECNLALRECGPSTLRSSVLSLLELRSRALTLGSTGHRPYTLNVVPMGLLNCLATPALKNLALSCPYCDSMTYGPIEDITPIPPFVSRSGFQLHTLSISFFQTIAPTLVNCLRAVPSLVHLKLKPVEIDLAHLLIQLRSNQLLPQLEFLHLVFPFDNITVDGATVSLAASLLHIRWSLFRGAQLQSFRLAHETDTSWFAEALVAHRDFDRLGAEGMFRSIPARAQWPPWAKWHAGNTQHARHRCSICFRRLGAAAQIGSSTVPDRLLEVPSFFIGNFVLSLFSCAAFRVTARSGGGRNDFECNRRMNATSGRSCCWKRISGDATDPPSLFADVNEEAVCHQTATIIVPYGLVDGEEGKPLSDNEKLISALQSGFDELIKKQEEQTIRIQRVIEALKPPRSTDTKTAFWESYMKLADEHDKEFHKKHSNDLDTSLIFAGLFSAVSSTFIIQLQPQLASNPSPIVILAQSFLYSSLFITLFTALLAVLGKQWITYYEAAGSRGSTEERGLERQRKFDGLRQWKFDIILQSFPLLLQLAVFLFSAALSSYLWTLHRTIAIIAITLTSSAFTVYVLLLASAVVSADSPFQTPLASLLVWLARLAFRNELRRFFSQALWPAISFLFSLPSKHLLPYFASDVSGKLGSRFVDLYPNNLFVPPSVEIPAVLWILENSTDHRMIEVAANMAVRLQWPLGLNLSPPMARLYETFQSCFEMHPNGSDRNVRPGMIHRAITCGRAYCSLRVVAHTSVRTRFRDMKILPSLEHQLEDPQFRQLLDVVAIAARKPTPLMGPWDDSFAVEWALHTTLRPLCSSPFELESHLKAFLDRFPLGKLSSLNHSGFTNYICLVNCFLSREEVRVASQRDKSSLRLSLLANLFEVLKTATISSDLTARIIHTVQSLDKLAGRMYIREEGPSALRLFVSVIDFCSTFAGTDGWLGVTVSAAKLARVEGQENWRNFQGVWHRNGCFQNVNPRNMDCIYMAIDHVQQSWEQARSGAEDPAT
ncbi:hypothetical protein MSAN_01053700 [Mycena sanguinolenta]|uniref:DUF6535 domain-containing protein n=1 Tax=Mycena sanguinolenta TaxID=230812 RepID=A0A8H7D6C5_9AGAR|nr:hypothetical protein MSAN_01053700 [Mycena sanguinolenta]